MRRNSDADGDMDEDQLKYQMEYTILQVGVLGQLVAVGFGVETQIRQVTLV